MTPRVAVVGVGSTAFTRRSGVSAHFLANEAFAQALNDAGLDPESVDGVIPVGGSIFVEDLVTCDPRRLTFDALPPPGGNSAVAALGLAQVAIQSGAATVVVLVFARNGSSELRIAERVTTLPGQRFREQLEVPSGWTSPAQWYAMICQRHMYEHGTTKDALAEVALAARFHAQLNPQAQMHGRTLSFEEYVTAPMIAEPYQLFDCCLETDGAVAVVVANEATARRLGRLPVWVSAVESVRPQSPDDLTNRDDWSIIGLTHAAPRAFAAAGIGPDDVDVAEIYDCFTFEVLHQLEEAGFCERGGSSELVADGGIRLGGRLPVNTHGGMLSGGHLGGMSHIEEAVLQVRGVCGARQVPDAKVAAVTGWGDWGDGSLALLTR